MANGGDGEVKGLLLPAEDRVNQCFTGTGTLMIPKSRSHTRRDHHHMPENADSGDFLGDLCCAGSLCVSSFSNRIYQIYMMCLIKLYIHTRLATMT